jgi:predicted DNA-binding protein (UPF0251 family)
MTSRDFITARLREAWDTLRRVPVKGVPALRSSWPQAVQDVAEAYGYTPPTVRLSPASPQAIDRMMQTFTWFEALEDHPHLTRAVWLTAAAGMGVKRASAVLGIHRDTVRARRDEALDRMADAVRRKQAR